MHGIQHKCPPVHWLYAILPHVRMPIDIMFGTTPSHTQSQSEYATHLRQENQHTTESGSTWDTSLPGRSHCMTRRSSRPFECGDLVWLHSPVTPRGQSRKLSWPWTGPFRIVRHISDATYRIQNVSLSHHRLVVHFDCLKLCPPNMRFPAESSTATVPTDSTSNDLVRPPGTCLEIVDEDNTPPPPPPPRYPRRRRGPPDYYAPGITH